MGRRSRTVGVVCIYLPAPGPLMKQRSSKSNAQYVCTVVPSACTRPRCIGTIILGERSSDEKHDNDVLLKGLEGIDGTTIKRSFVIDADEKSI